MSGGAGIEAEGSRRGTRPKTQERRREKHGRVPPKASEGVELSAKTESEAKRFLRPPRVGVQEKVVEGSSDEGARNGAGPRSEFCTECRVQL